MDTQDSQQLKPLDDLRIKFFSIIKELKHINEWLADRGAPLVIPEEMPKIGYIAYYDGMPVAAAFLRRCEGNFGMIDSLVTDPSVAGDIRNAAIDHLVVMIVKAARKLNLKSLVGYSVDASTLNRSIKHGFKKLPLTVITKDLRIFNDGDLFQ